jgi:dTDP-4-dehydrorhamnose 3,5-epimerase
MIVTATSIQDLIVIAPKIHLDPRGEFFEVHNTIRYQLHGIPTFVQDNVSKSKRGVLRGLHYQTSRPQAKLVSVLKGSIYDVAVDLRVASPTFGYWEAVTLSAENHLQFFVPEGFAHGFLALEEDTIVSYKCSDYYSPANEKTLRYDDPYLNIPWTDIGQLTVSCKDLNGQTFLTYENEFLDLGKINNA